MILWISCSGASLGIGHWWNAETERDTVKKKVIQRAAFAAAAQLPVGQCRQIDKLYNNCIEIVAAITLISVSGVCCRVKRKATVRLVIIIIIISWQNTGKLCDSRVKKRILGSLFEFLVATRRANHFIICLWRDSLFSVGIIGGSRLCLGHVVVVADLNGAPQTKSCSWSKILLQIPWSLISIVCALLGEKDQFEMIIGIYGFRFSSLY